MICNFVFLKQCVEDSSLLQRVAELQEQMLQQQQKLDEQQHELVELRQQQKHERKVVQELHNGYNGNSHLLETLLRQSLPKMPHWSMQKLIKVHHCTLTGLQWRCMDRFISSVNREHQTA